jgi:FkbM family methyltransferase
MHYKEIAPYFPEHKIININIDGYTINLNTQFLHDQQYLVKLLFDIKTPQADIDSALFKAFVNKDDRIIDAGANIGFTAIEFIKSGASFVLAIEPVPEIFSRLSKNSFKLAITPLQLALDDKVGFVNMTVSEIHNHGSTINKRIPELFPQVFGVKPKIIRVPTITLDKIVERYGVFDIWKLDVEGSEVKALKGGLNALKNTSPRIIIAEIYQEFLQEFLDIITPIFPYSRRAFLKKEDYSLDFTDVKIFDELAYEVTSPMYVFFRDQTTLESIRK